jgi:aryl-alcohol dehydrogenase-like predicted oxidoreductase
MAGLLSSLCRTTTRFVWVAPSHFPNLNIIAWKNTNKHGYQYREEEREMNRYCNATGVGLIPWAPLYRGHLARPVGSEATERSKTGQVTLSEADKAIIGRVEEIAKKKGWAMAQVALAWIIQRNTIPIVGFSSVARMTQAVEVKGKELTDEEMKYLQEPYVPKAVAGHA